MVVKKAQWFVITKQLHLLIESRLQDLLFPMEYEILQYAIYHCGACIDGGILRSAISGDGMPVKDVDLKIPEDTWPDFLAFCTERNYYQYYTSLGETRHFMAHYTSTARGIYGFDVWIGCNYNDVPPLDMACNAFVYRGIPQIGIWKYHMFDIRYPCDQNETDLNLFQTFLQWCIEKTTYSFHHVWALPTFLNEKKKRLERYGWCFMDGCFEQSSVFALNNKSQTGEKSL